MNWWPSILDKRYGLILWVGLPVLSLLMHLPILDLPLQGVHAWRQCETASNIEHFALEGGSVLDPHVYSLEWEGGLKRMELPIMQWVIARPYSWAGRSVWMMRLCIWIIGLFGIWGMWSLVKALTGDLRLALLVAWCWTFSPVLFYYGVNPIPDNLSLSVSTWGLATALRWYRSHHWWQWLTSCALLSLATATKLPFVLLFSFPAGLWLLQLWQTGKRKWLSLCLLAVGGLLLLLPALFWYAWVIPQWTGNGVVKGILDSTLEDVPKLIKIFGKNLIVILPELLLNYAAVPFFIWGIVRVWKEKLYGTGMALPFGLMGLAAGTYFVFEINMIADVHDYYLFPFMPGLFVLVVLGLGGLLAHEKAWLRKATWVLLFVLPVTCGLRAYPRWNLKNMPVGVMGQVEELRAATPLDSRIIFANDLSPHISLYHLRHWGWTFDMTTFEPAKYEDWVGNKGAEYLYCNSRLVENHPAVAPTLKELVQKYGAVWVWRIGPASTFRPDKDRRNE